MITSLKLSEYERFHGYYDGFYQQKVKLKKNLTSDYEWHLIEVLRQDIKIVMNGLASEEFSNDLNRRLIENIDNSETIKQLFELAKKNW